MMHYDPWNEPGTCDRWVRRLSDYAIQVGRGHPWALRLHNAQFKLGWWMWQRSFWSQWGHEAGMRVGKSNYAIQEVKEVWVTMQWIFLKLRGWAYVLTLRSVQFNLGWKPQLLNSGGQGWVVVTQITQWSSLGKLVLCTTQWKETRSQP